MCLWGALGIPVILCFVAFLLTFSHLSVTTAAKNSLGLGVGVGGGLCVTSFVVCGVACRQPFRLYICMGGVWVAQRETFFIADPQAGEGAQGQGVPQRSSVYGLQGVSHLLLYTHTAAAAATCGTLRHTLRFDSLPTYMLRAPTRL